MRKLYAFSPITTKAQFDEALAYIVREADRLAELLTSTELKLSTAKVFAHYPEEYELMTKLIREYGEPSTIGRYTSIYVSTDLDIEGSHLDHVGIRIPDPYRMQVGCGNYAVDNLHEFIKTLPKNEHDYIRQFPEMKDKFVELWHPDFDLTGYIVVQ